VKIASPDLASTERHALDSSDASEFREAFGVRRIPALSTSPGGSFQKAPEYGALQTLRDGDRLAPFRASAAFTLMEVVIASAIFFLAIFAILALVSNTLRNARSLRHIQVDAGMVAAQLFKTNKFSEQVESGDFGSAYPDYSWSVESMEAQTNGLWQFNVVVMRRGQREPVDQMSLFIFSPESSTGPFGPGPGPRPR